jgi:hypothetical protein
MEAFKVDRIILNYIITMSGDKVILQIVPSSVENVLANFEGELIVKWQNVSLTRLDGLEICVWQMIDVTTIQAVEKYTNSNANGTQTGQGIREIDNNLFIPHCDAVIIFYEIKDKTAIVDWLRAIADDVRFKDITPIIVGCYSNGESTDKFHEIFNDEDTSRVFLWCTDGVKNSASNLDSQEQIVEIYEAILSLI